MIHTEPWMLCFSCPACLLGRAFGILLGLAVAVLVVLSADPADAEERPRREYRLYDQSSKNDGLIRETEPNTYQMYDPQSKRTGTIYVRPDGHVDIFAPDGKRIGPRISPSTPHTPTRRTP